ncbi:MAG TPA: 30S ribosomal protein S9 [Firmicutes bacterium]|nr:30S ribosomal protein S9 [Bacillota bacterium]
MSPLIAGKRKTSIARVKLTSGKGTITVNGKSFEEYFPILFHRLVVLQPFKETGREGKYDVVVKVEGGGKSSQAQAIRHAISRALSDLEPSLRQTLKSKGLLSFDARIKERKKPGLHRARKARQYRKR